MCGIVGIYEYNDSQKVDEKALVRARDTMAYRGPDDAGLYVSSDKKVGLGHRRLSIIDISFAGHQPFSNKDRSIWIVFNGEIYNYLEIRSELVLKGYSFKSDTDTEVIIYAYEEWGEECVKKFNGMWSFALWDTHKQNLFCSRDRFGVKPFYYYLDRERFVFASEIKAMLSWPFIPRVSNDSKIFEYLAFSFLDTTSQTFFQKIEQLKPAHNLTLKNGQLKTYRYWDILEKKVENLSDNEIKEKFRFLLQDAIRLRFRSDVPVAVLLSGGLDSSAIACLAANAMPNTQINVFSAVYPGQTCDESDYIQAVLQKYPNLNPNFIYPQSGDLSKEIGKIIWHQDEPFSSTTTLSHWLLMKEINKAGIKVVLSGQGADEVLAGYYDSFGYYLVELLRQGSIKKFQKEFKLIAKNYQFSKTYLALNLIKSLLPRKAANLLRGALKDKIFYWLNFSFIAKYYGYAFSENKFKNVFSNNLWRLLATDSLPRILHYEDRGSMAFSIEERVPFLDYRLVEFIFSLPDKYKIDNGLTKTILRDSLKNIVPEEILQRKIKIGFSTPIKQWLQVNEKLAGTPSTFRFTRKKYLKEYAVKKMMPIYMKGTQNQNEVVWRIINLELWLKEFFI